MDFYWGGPLNSGPRSNTAFLPVLLDLYAKQHPGPALSLSPRFVIFITPTIGTAYAFVCTASLPERGYELHEGRNCTCVFCSVPRVWFPVAASLA